MTLTFIEMQHLKNLADKHSLDIQEIDNTLSYEENKKHLLEIAHVEAVKPEEAVRAHAEQTAAEAGLRVVTEREHATLVDLLRREEAVKAKAKALRETEERLAGAAVAGAVREIVKVPSRIKGVGCINKGHSVYACDELTVLK